MLEPVHLRDLLVEPGAHPRSQPHLSAASGLVQVGRWLYVVADDEHHLGVLDADGPPTGAVRLQRLLHGDLPHGKAARKKRKPDLEALAFLPPAAGLPHGGLLALGSGSRTNRQRGFVLKVGSDGTTVGEATAIDLAALYQPLRSEFADLNIEGALMADGQFHLLQRGNKGDARNACISYPLAEMRDWIAGRRGEPPGATRIACLALGEVRGVPLGLTDATALPGGGWAFSAVAEDTGDSYHDGACAGSAIGQVDRDGRLLRIEAISDAPKVEGIALAGAQRLLMVTDADDPATASALWSVDLR
jgi:hypothetical protein